MARMIPLFLAEDEENTSTMTLQRVFRRFRFSSASISHITGLIADYLNFTKRSYAAPTTLFVWYINFSLLERSR